MSKHELLNTYEKQEDKLLIAKILDAIEQTKTKNRIVNTDFLDLYQTKIIMKLLNKIKKQNYLIFGGYEEAERKMIIFYPEKLTKDIVLKNINNIMKAIRIELPNDLKGQYTHKNYLGGIMKLGVKREKLGDILVQDDGADVIISKDILRYIKENIILLKRFSKSNIAEINVEDIKVVETKKEEREIIVSSLRLDSIVAELAKTSRNKASEIIALGRVFVNYENEIKLSKEIKIGDIITIRGKGKYKIKQLIRNTKREKNVVKIEKYI